MRHSSWQQKGHKMRLIESKRRKGRVVRGKRVKRKRGRQDGFQEENEGEIFLTPAHSLQKRKHHASKTSSLRRVPIVRVVEQGHLLPPPVRLPNREHGSRIEFLVGRRDVVPRLLDVPLVGSPDDLPCPPRVARPVLDVVDALGARVRDDGLDRLRARGVLAVLCGGGNVRGELRGGGDAGDLARFVFFLGGGGVRGCS